MKRLLFLLLIIVLCLSLAACSSKDNPSSSNEADSGSEAAVDDTEVEMDIIEISDTGTSIIQFGIPKDSAFEVPEAALGMVVKNGDFGIEFSLFPPRIYVDGSAVNSTLQEMIDYRKEATSHSFSEVSYAGMNGFAQDNKAGRIMLYFPIDDSLQRYPEMPEVLEVTLSYREDEVIGSDEFAESRKALDDFLATDEVQMILNSIKLLPVQSS